MHTAMRRDWPADSSNVRTTNRKGPPRRTCLFLASVTPIAAAVVIVSHSPTFLLIRSPFPCPDSKREKRVGKERFMASEPVSKSNEARRRSSICRAEPGMLFLVALL
jgi:hypothetical protein